MNNNENVKHVSKDQEIKRIKVESREYIISPIKIDKKYLCVENLSEDIACILFSRVLEKVALARNIDQNQMQKLIQEMNNNNIIESGLISVQIVGGTDSQQTEYYSKQLLTTLNVIDGGTNMINIVGYDVGKTPHPDNLSVDCYNGLILDYF